MCRAGLSRSNPSRIAAFSAERRVARMRCSVEGVTGRPYRVGAVAMVVIMSATCRPPRRMFAAHDQASAHADVRAYVLSGAGVIIDT